MDQAQQEVREFMAVKKPAKKTKAAKKFQGRAGGEEGWEKEKSASRRATLID
jgi:hypothetical protein